MKLAALLLESGSDSRRPVLVVAQDIGGAEGVFRELKALTELPRFRVLLAASTRDYFLQDADYKHWIEDLSIELEQLDTESFSCILTGTSIAQDSLERMAWKYGVEKEIPAFALLDHWVHYDERFQIEGDAYLFPDKVLCHNPQSYRLGLASMIPSERCVLFESAVISKPKAQYARPGHLVYVTSPLRQSIDDANVVGSRYSFDEFEALELFCRHLTFAENRWTTLTIRLHPTEAISKYDTLLSTFEFRDSIKIVNYKVETLDTTFEQTALVFGTDSSTLVRAVHENKVVVSLTPTASSECTLPEPRIIHINQLMENIDPSAMDPVWDIYRLKFERSELGAELGAPQASPHSNAPHFDE